MNNQQDSIQLIALWLAESKKSVIFTGAGISTESGIPDFRSPGGIWTKYRTVYFDEFMDSAEARHEYWQQKCEGHRDFADAKPNAGHNIIAKWEAEQLTCGVITQNIDGLHTIAGSREVLELHGTARQIKCMDCEAMFDVEPMVKIFLETDTVPACPKCNIGRLKHATISFGQSLSPDVLQKAYQWCRDADLILALGSSLVVTPAADLPVTVKKHGGRVVIINRDETGLDEIADVKISGSIGKTLTEIEQAIQS